MPYAKNEDLPATVRDHLPAHAQDIFRETFNRTFADHEDDETTAFHIAWAAVKRRYVKVGSHWVPKAKDQR